VTDREKMEAEAHRLTVKKQHLDDDCDRLDDEEDHLGDRIDAERDRIEAEYTRVVDAGVRNLAAIAEYNRTHPRRHAMSDSETLEAERDRAYAELGRITAERGRITAEYNRIRAERVRNNAERAEYDRTHPPETSDD